MNSNSFVVWKLRGGPASVDVDTSLIHVHTYSVHVPHIHVPVDIHTTAERLMRSPQGFMYSALPTFHSSLRESLQLFLGQRQPAHQAGPALPLS